MLEQRRRAGRSTKRVGGFVHAALLFSALAFVTARARAQTPEWYPDRPNLTVSPQVLPVGYLGFDMGLSYTGSAPGDEDLLTVPIKLRWPLAAAWELQLGYDLFGWIDEPEEPAHTGSGDLFAASRTILAEPQDPWPALAVELGATIPAASRRPDFGSGKPSFYALVAVEFTAYDNVWLDLNIGLELSGVRGEARTFVADEFVTGAIGLTMARAFEPYLELRWESTHGDGAGDLTVIDFGMVSYLGDRFALDASIAAGLSKAAPDLLLVMGFSVLFGPD